MAQRRSTVWIDAAGMTRQTIMSTSAGGASIEADLLAMSNAGRLDEWEGTSGGPAGSPVASTFESVADYALLYWTCADGTIASLTLPSPKAAIFLSDGVTVDSTNADVVTLIASVNGSLLSASGSAASAYVGGKRLRANRDYA